MAIMATLVLVCKMTSLTLFKSIYDNETVKSMEFSDWQQFEALLYKLSKAKLNSKKDASLISPASYIKGTTRANINVTQWSGWAALDVDDHKFEGDLQSELRNRFGNFYYVCYSTASSTADHPKFRLVFPLRNAVKSPEIKQFWWALNSELGAIGDKQTKDLSRMYYIPASYANANNFIFTNVGDIINPTAFISKHPMPQKPKTIFDGMSETMRNSILQYRANGLTNTNYSWSSYTDCPFVSRRMIAEYNAISQTGWYAKMYAFMVSVAGNAISKKYPISTPEVVHMCKELDRDTGGWYKSRAFDTEAERAISYVMENQL
jgi:hypothetical protein